MSSPFLITSRSSNQLVHRRVGCEPLLNSISGFPGVSGRVSASGKRWDFTKRPLSPVNLQTPSVKVSLPRLLARLVYHNTNPHHSRIEATDASERYNLTQAQLLESAILLPFLADSGCPALSAIESANLISGLCGPGEKARFPRNDHHAPY